MGSFTRPSTSARQGVDGRGGYFQIYAAFDGISPLNTDAVAYTSEIPYDATAAEVKAAIEGLENVDARRPRHQATALGSGGVGGGLRFGAYGAYPGTSRQPLDAAHGGDGLRRRLREFNQPTLDLRTQPMSAPMPSAGFGSIPVLGIYKETVASACFCVRAAPAATHELQYRQDEAAPWVDAPAPIDVDGSGWATATLYGLEAALAAAFAGAGSWRTPAGASPWSLSSNGGVATRDPKPPVPSAPVATLDGGDGAILRLQVGSLETYRDALDAEVFNRRAEARSLKEAAVGWAAARQRDPDYAGGAGDGGDGDGNGGLVVLAAYDGAAAHPIKGARGYSAVDGDGSGTIAVDVGGSDARDLSGPHARHRHVDLGERRARDYRAVAAGGRGASQGAGGDPGAPGSFEVSTEGVVVSTSQRPGAAAVATCAGAIAADGGARARNLGGAGGSGKEGGGGGGGGYFGAAAAARASTRAAAAAGPRGSTRTSPTDRSRRAGRAEPADARRRRREPQRRVLAWPPNDAATYFWAERYHVEMAEGDAGGFKLGHSLTRLGGAPEIRAYRLPSAELGAVFLFGGHGDGYECDAATPPRRRRLRAVFGGVKEPDPRYVEDGDLEFAYYRDLWLLDVGAPRRATWSWTGGSPPTPPAGRTRTTYFDVNVTAGDEWCLRDVDIYVRISHPCASQLSISVVGPGPVSGDGNFRDLAAASRPVLLHAPDANSEACDRLDPPFSTQDALNDFGYKGDPGMLFDDDASRWTPAPDAKNPHGGTFRPVDALAEFEGARPSGTWTLVVTDHSGGLRKNYNAGELDGMLRAVSRSKRCERRYVWRNVTNATGDAPPALAGALGVSTGDSLFVYGGRTASDPLPTRRCGATTF
ncbi:hypothetical protein SO694_00125065 [Aureococcus anophagefferens]|uniref:P/Homo B domain-containing protein n=1 Tax=Aureococcus anophagefferens TaxID=44056 RepID=A0ABR1G431_AURAN